MSALSLFVCALSLLTTVIAFYLPGLAPVNYCSKTGEDNANTCKNEIPLYVNRLNTEESVIPFEYHHFDFCTTDETQSPVENLGQVVFGERIRPSPYKLNFMENVECAAVCSKTYKASNAESLKKLNLLKMGMALYYQHHWILDNMPVTWCYLVDKEKTYCSTGFPMGCQVRRDLDTCTPIVSTSQNQVGSYFLFNHVDIEITYHSGAEEEWGVGFGENGGRIISAKPAQSTGKLDSGMRGPYKVVRVLPHHRYELELLAGSYGKKTQAAAQNMVLWRGEWTPDTCAAFFEDDNDVHGENGTSGVTDVVINQEAAEDVSPSGTAVLTNTEPRTSGATGATDRPEPVAGPSWR